MSSGRSSPSFNVKIGDCVLDDDGCWWRATEITDGATTWTEVPPQVRVVGALFSMWTAADLAGLTGMDGCLFVAEGTALIGDFPPLRPGATVLALRLSAHDEDVVTLEHDTEEVVRLAARYYKSLEHHRADISVLDERHRTEMAALDEHFREITSPSKMMPASPPPSPDDPFILCGFHVVGVDEL